jgi:signal transduction histidine kinase
MLAAYYLAVPYRLLQEHQHRSRLQRSHEVLMQVEELKTNFLSLVTHDLKTPVARIQGLAEVLLMKASSRLVERDIKSLHHIVESTDELNRFISSILELAKIESAELKPRFESKDLNRLVEKAVDGFKAPARAKHCRIETELDPLFPISMDPSLIQKVIHNLLDNAIKYSPEGSTIRVRTREIDSHVEFSVRDEGVGLNALEQEQLFQKFYRAKNSATSHVGGSGLGLYLCKYFIEAHSGSIDVESSPGAGSAFIFRLPLEQPKSEKGLKPGLKTTALSSLSQNPQEGRA